MTGIVRTSVLNGNLLIVLTTGTQLLVNKNTLDGMTDEQINNFISVFVENNQIEPCGIHRNRNGSYLVWTGQAPAVWPEDEPEIP